MPAAPSVTAAPDFVGVGAQRAGTTWWFWSLVEHPAIRAAEIAPGVTDKELHFFDRFSGVEMRERDVARYARRFPRAPGQIAGEWTPRYASDLWTAPLLKRAAPDAKLLLMLRDPVERFRSGVAYRRRAQPGRRPDFLAADALDRTRYAAQLARLRRHWAADEILVLQYERCCADPAGEYRRTLRFLGVEEDHVPPGLAEPRGPSVAAYKEPLWPELLSSLLEVVEPDVAELARMVPDLDLALWPSVAHLAERVPA
jgi:hypothetical protein